MAFSMTSIYIFLCQYQVRTALRSRLSVDGESLGPYLTSAVSISFAHFLTVALDSTLAFGDMKRAVYDAFRLHEEGKAGCTPAWNETIIR